MGNIPSSRWVIEENYFKVKFIENIREEYLKWLWKYEGYRSLDELISIVESGGEPSLSKFLDRISKGGEFEIYQQPFDHSSNNCETVKYEFNADYFEKEDDNCVIPRHLFELI